MKTSIKLYTIVSLTFLSACGGTNDETNLTNISEEIEQTDLIGLSPSTGQAIDPSTITDPSATYFGSMSTLLMADTDPNYNNGEEIVYVERVKGDVTLNATFENGHAEIDGSATNFVFQSEDFETTVVNDIDTMSGTLSIDGIIDGTTPHDIDITGTLTGDNYDGTVSLTGVIPMQITQEGDDQVISGSGTLNVDTDYPFAEDIDENTVLVATKQN